MRHIRSTGLEIAFSDKLKSLDGLEALVSINGGLQVFANPGLTTLQGMDRLSSLEGSIHILHNSNLNNIEALEFLQTISGDLVFIDNRLLVELRPLNQVEHIEGTLRIRGQAGWTNLDWLVSLQSLGGLRLEDNDALVEISALHEIRHLEDLHVQFNGQLQTLHGLESLETVNRLLRISNNPSLASLEALSNLRSVGSGVVDISGNSLIPRRRWRRFWLNLIDAGVWVCGSIGAAVIIGSAAIGGPHFAVVTYFRNSENHFYFKKPPTFPSIFSAESSRQALPHIKRKQLAPDFSKRGCPRRNQDTHRNT